MEEINEFDDQIKRALEQLGDDLPGSDWNLFEQKLAAESLSAEENGLSDTKFDEQIRAEMNQFDAGADNMHWDELASKIDQELYQPEISDEALDELVVDHLQNLYIPYNSAHWTLMSHRLEEEFSMRRKIVKYKVAEVAMMLLLLLTIAQYIPDYSKQKQTKGKTTQNHLADLEKEDSQNNVSDDHAVNEKTETTASLSTSNPQTNSAVTANNNYPLSGMVTGTTNRNLQQEALEIPIASTLIITSEQNHITPTPENEIQATIITAPSSELLNEVSILSSSTTIPHLDILDENLVVANSEDFKLAGEIMPITKGLVVRLGGVTEMNTNHIITPSTNRYKDDGYSQYRLGYGGGITVDFQFNKLTFSTGLIYRRINYEPQKTVNISGSFANGYQSYVFDAVNLNLLTIPLNVHFNLNNHQTSRWKIYGMTGTSLNLLALNHYNVSVNNLGSPPPGPAPLGTEINRNIDNLYAENELAGEGLFEGGSFNRNHYFSANVGLGVERLVSRRWSVFLQPVYQYQLFGKELGPNNDKIHTMSIQIGAKSTFK